MEPAWPQRTPIRFVAGFPAGGLADVIARLVAQPLGEALGTTMVVENRTGASGNIGADAMAKSPADGYTLAVSHAIPFGFAPGVLPSVPYDPVTDFTHLGMLAEAATVMVVRAASPLAWMTQALDTAKRTTVTFGSSGVGSAEHILGAVMARAAGATNLVHVPYRGTPPALQDLLSGQIDILNAPISTLVPMLRDGTLRLVVTSTARRLPAFPNVLTMAELGFPQATMTQSIGVSAPRGLPAPIAGRNTAVLPTVLALPQANSLVHAEDGGAVESVMVGGCLVVADRKLLHVDMDRLAREAENAVDRLQRTDQAQHAMYAALEPLVGQFCPALAAEPYHVHRYAACDHLPH